MATSLARRTCSSSRRALEMSSTDSLAASPRLPMDRGLGTRTTMAVEGGRTQEGGSSPASPAHFAGALAGSVPFCGRGDQRRKRRATANRGTDRFSPSRTSVLRLLVSPAVAADDALHDTLNLAELDPDGVELRVGGLEADVVVFLEEGLQGGGAVRKEGHDLVAVGGNLGALDQDEVAIQDPFVPHGVALDLQGEGGVLTLVGGRRQDLAQVDLVLVGDALDGVPGSYFADQGEAEGAGLIWDRDSLSDRQRASLVRFADQGLLLDECFDVLEDRDLADPDFVRELLHGRGIALAHAPVADQLKDAELLGSQVHGLASFRSGTSLSGRPGPSRPGYVRQSGLLRRAPRPEAG